MSARESDPTPAQSPGVWRDVLRLARLHPLVYAMSTAGIWSFYLFPLLPGALIQRIFKILEHPPGDIADARSAIWVLAAALFGAELFRSVFAIGWPFEKTLIGLIGALMRHNMLRRILQRPGAAPLPAGSSSGEAISRFRNDLAHIGEFVTWTADPTGQAMAVGIAMVTLLRIDATIAALAFLPIVLIVVSVNLISRRIRQYREANQTSIGAVTGLLGELFGAAQAIKVAGAEPRVITHLRQANEARRTATLRDTLLKDVIDAMSFGASHIATGVLLVLSAQALREGRMSTGDLALFASYLGWLTTVSGMVGAFVTRYRQVDVSFNRVRALMQGAPPEQLLDTRGKLPWPRRGPATIAAAPVDSEPLLALTVRGLRYRYPGSENGIGPIDLDIARGQFVVITGRIGSGKTTLLRALLGLLPPDAGELRWNGALISDPANFLTPPHAAYAPQTPRLFSETLRDNILLGQPGGALDQAIWQAVLERDIPALEHGLESMIGPRGVKLSGGQLQRAAAARMFVRQPELLVLDDISSALDGDTETTLWARLAERPGATCLVVSHRRAALQRADLIVLLVDGLPHASGTLEALLAGSAEMRALWEGLDPSP